jgi:hypothetical protein
VPRRQCVALWRRPARRFPLRHSATSEASSASARCQPCLRRVVRELWVQYLGWAVMRLLRRVLWVGAVPGDPARLRQSGGAHAHPAVRGLDILCGCGIVA